MEKAITVTAEPAVEVVGHWYGTQSKDVTFHIGREQISTVDPAAKEMTVARDGATLVTCSVTGGDASHATWSGRRGACAETPSPRLIRHNGRT